MDLGYLIDFGVGPYSVDVDFDYDGVWNSAPAGRTVMISNANVIPENITQGAKQSLDVAVPVTIPDGEYVLAIRITDSSPPADGGPFTKVVAVYAYSLPPQ
jgi:hypothetical protein